jgi:hypothetical protein
MNDIHKGNLKICQLHIVKYFSEKFTFCIFFFSHSLFQPQQSPLKRLCEHFQVTDITLESEAQYLLKNKDKTIKLR